MTAKYGALRIISLIYKALALLVLTLTVGGLCVSLLTSPSVVRDYDARFINRDALAILGMLIPLLVGSVVSISLYASGELIDLLIDMEENTRASRIVLTRLAKWMANDPARGAGTAGVHRPSTSPSPDAIVDEFMPDIDEF